MTKQIQKLIEQATKVVEPDDPDYRHEFFDKEKFARLIIQECLEEIRDEIQYQLNWKFADSVVERVLKHFD